jgi:diguanylate cyclase (GGDEF)-like protein
MMQQLGAVPPAGQAMDGFKLRIALPVFVVTLAAVLMAGAGLYWATARSDAISVERQVRETRQAISSSLDEMALNQESLASWDDPVLELRKPDPDWQWFDDNIGTWLHTPLGQDQVYILDGADVPVYAVLDGERTDPESYKAVAASFQHLVETVRGRVPDDNNIHERLPGRPLHPASTVRTTEKAVHATELISIQGRPAAASAMLIMPLTEKVAPAPGAEPILIGISFLDGRFLQHLSKHNLIEAPRFSQSLDLGAGEHAWQLASEHGEPIGYFIWKPELPGTTLLFALAPTAAAALGILIVVMALLAFWLCRAMRAQQDAIKQLQASEAQAQHLAFHDTLTGLPNRAKFCDRLDKALMRARHGEPMAILLLDLDRFKHVNDTLGHLAGDALIRQFSERLLHLLDEDDTVARLGGDEFAILYGKAHAQEGAEALCNRILQAVHQPFDLLGNAAFVGVSIGVAIAPDAGTERFELLRKADIALYKAKGEGRDCYRVFTPAMDDGVKLRGAIEEELRIALDTGRGMLVHYQPQVAGTGRTIIGLEALVRWQHPTMGLIAPDQFIAVAEETGLICQLGEWVLRQACLATRRWPGVFIAVNLSPVQFRTTGFADRIMSIVREYGVDPGRLEFEVTESLLLDESEAASDTLKRLRAEGFRIALDDFGTGYSSLSYLRRFEVDKIKIDRSFVQHVGQGVDSTAIISAVLTLGHAMGLSVTAEGVETAEQRSFLTAAGCNSMQGYLFSRPLPEDGIDRLMGNAAMRGAA